MIDAAALKTAFAGFTCDKMGRAWRNRSNVTRWAWEDRAANLGNRALASVLYAACGELCDQQLDPAGWTAAYWDTLAGLIEGFLAYKPDKALSRGEYEARRKETMP